MTEDGLNLTGGLKGLCPHAGQRTTVPSLFNMGWSWPIKNENLGPQGKVKAGWLLSPCCLALAPLLPSDRGFSPFLEDLIND